MSLGYIGNHEEENKAFETLPDDRVMYRSGGLGYMLPNGELAFLHRKDTRIMIPEFIVRMLQIPLNSNGKPDMSRLPVVMKAGRF